jgi:nuclear transport factor 2 (NTF2) superfamily protein
MPRWTGCTVTLPEVTDLCCDAAPMVRVPTLGAREDAIVAFLRRKWAKELDYRLMKELWCFHENRISVRFEYEWHDPQGQWYRSHGNEHWEFDAQGLMRRRDASINDVRIDEAARRYRTP